MHDDGRWIRDQEIGREGSFALLLRSANAREKHGFGLCASTPDTRQLTVGGGHNAPLTGGLTRSARRGGGDRLCSLHALGGAIPTSLRWPAVVQLREGPIGRD